MATQGKLSAKFQTEVTFLVLVGSALSHFMSTFENVLNFIAMLPPQMLTAHKHTQPQIDKLFHQSVCVRLYLHFRRSANAAKLKLHIFISCALLTKTS